jgi:hypothetical protein
LKYRRRWKILTKKIFLGGELKNKLFIFKGGGGGDVEKINFFLNKLNLNTKNFTLTFYNLNRKLNKKIKNLKQKT